MSRSGPELFELFRVALAAVDPERLVADAVERTPGGARIAGRPAGSRIALFAAGKAAAPMARAARARLGPLLRRGLVVTADGCELPVPGIPVRTAGHPIPDARSQAAAEAAVELAESLAPGESLLALLSGGASALLGAPVPGLDLADVVRTSRALYRAGVDIEALNTVRKHLCAAAGGRLARAARGAPIHLLALSDVPGDRLDLLASGPFHPDPSTCSDALAVIREAGVEAEVGPRVIACLEAGRRGEREETPKPGDPCFARLSARVLAGTGHALAAAEKAAREAGMAPVRLTHELRGEARRVGDRLAALALSIRRGGAPRLLTAGGETTVTVRGPGVGGRNQELALAAALRLAGREGVEVLAAGTDGIDGPTPAAGAQVDGETVPRARALGLRPEEALEANDSHPLLAAAGALVVTGPTRTNVRDVVLVRVAAASGPPPARPW